MLNRRKTGPLVSAVICNHNYGQFVGEAIQSALDQTYENVEVIVVDDGSTDDSWPVIQAQPSCVHRLRIPHSGQLATFWTGTQASRGEIICLLDSDDVWHPGKVAEVVAVFETNPELHWVRHQLAVADVALKPLGRFAPHIRRTGPSPSSPFRYLERVLSLSTSGLSLNRDTAMAAFASLNEHLGRFGLGKPFGGILYHADACIGAIVGARRLPGYSLNRTLGFYRRHKNHRFAGTQGVLRALQQEREVTEIVTRIWNQERGENRKASHAYKHSLIIETLTTGRTWTASRLALFARGLLLAMSLIPHDSWLAARQTMALIYALAAPHSWLRRLHARQCV